MLPLTSHMYNNNNKIEYRNSLDKSRVSVFGLHDKSTCSVTVTGVAEGAGGSGAKSKKPIGTPRIPPF